MECKKCMKLPFMELQQNRHKAKRLVRMLLSGLIKCQNCKSHKLKVIDRDALKEEWDITDE